MLSTSHKIRIARLLSTVVVSARDFFNLPRETVVTRKGVRWSLNLKEGIDLAIYLLGGFEPNTLQRYTQLIKPGDVILDIGANVGAHTLPLAQLAGPSGKVYSFEPTAYAFAKQSANIALNPQLAARIHPHQMMLIAKDGDPLPDAVYSSWPLETASDLHGEHHGRLMTTHGSIKDTLDNFVRQHDIKKINFIKLDVDGNEYDVLTGAAGVIEQYKPRIMLELAPYVYREAPEKFDDMLRLLWQMDYKLSDLETARLLPQDPVGIRKLIPDAGGMNVLATAESEIF